MTLKLGLYQGAGIPGDIDANLAEMQRAIVDSAAQGIELLAFPECYLTGYYLPDATPTTVPDTSAAVAALAAICCNAGIAIVFGLAERQGDIVFNTAIALGPDGSELARYRKRALFGEWEKGLFTRGSAPVRFDLGQFSIALLICYDVEFPELVRESALLGADLILVPTCLMQPYDAVAEHLIITRAIENQVFVAYANRCGSENGLDYAGKSIIADPNGKALATATATGPAMISATLDKAAIAAARNAYSYHADLGLLSQR
jgi:predicted amidohydrolase